MVQTKTKTTDKTILIPVLFGMCGAWVIASLFLSTSEEIFSGLLKLLTSPVSLTTDSIAVAGQGGTVMNAAINGLIVAILFSMGSDKLNGTSLAAFSFTIGFSFLGINAVNLLILIIGGAAAAKLSGRSFFGDMNTVVFSNTLAPIVSELLFGRYIALPMWIKIIAAFGVSLLIGFIFPLVCKQTAKLYNGLNQYNAGFAGGLVALVFYGVYKNCAMKALGATESFAMNSITAGRLPLVLIFMALPVFVAAIVCAVLRRGMGGYMSLLKNSGYKSSFSDSFGIALCIVNFGIIFAVMVGYYFVIGFTWTSGAVCACFGAAGFAAVGSNPRNIYPIILGYCLFSLISGTSLSANAFTIGLGYAMGMVPIAGEYGIIWGTISGFLHCAIVTETGAFHGGFCLYNGGFTSGLIAAFVAPAAEHFAEKKNKK